MKIAITNLPKVNFRDPSTLQAFDKDRGETVAVKKMNFSGKQASEKWTDIVKEV